MSPSASWFVASRLSAASFAPRCHRPPSPRTATDDAQHPTRTRPRRDRHRRLGVRPHQRGADLRYGLRAAVWLHARRVPQHGRSVRRPSLEADFEAVEASIERAVETGKAYRADFRSTSLTAATAGSSSWCRSVRCRRPAGSYSRHSDQHHRPQGGPAAARRPEQPAGTAQQARPPRHPQRGVFDHDAGRTVRVRPANPEAGRQSARDSTATPETDPKTEIDERAAQIAASSGGSPTSPSRPRTHVGHLVAGRLAYSSRPTEDARPRDRQRVDDRPSGDDPPRWVPAVDVTANELLGALFRNL